MRYEPPHDCATRTHDCRRRDISGTPVLTRCSVFSKDEATTGRGCSMDDARRRLRKTGVCAVAALALVSCAPNPPQTPPVEPIASFTPPEPAYEEVGVASWYGPWH